MLHALVGSQRKREDWSKERSRAILARSRLEAIPVAQTATVGHDPAVTSVAELRRVAERCGFECAGCNAPGCRCDPARQPGPPERAHDQAAVERAHAPQGTGRAAMRATRWSR